MSARAVTIGSLFSGIGGLDLSVEAFFASLGFVARTVWQVEHDAFCRSVLARHYPGAARNVHDVRAAGVANLAPVDAICGGFPCQPVSLAGRRKARNDARWLWPEFARILGELRPRYVFLENVPGLLTADDGRAFGDVLGSLASLGFAAEWDHFRASDVGAPHRRERWFLLAYCDDASRASQPEGRERDERGRALDGGESGAVAHAARLGEREPTDEAHAVADRRRARSQPRGVGEPLADPRGGTPDGDATQRVSGSAPAADARAGGEGVGVDLVDSDCEHREERDRGAVATRAELSRSRGGDIVDGGGAAFPSLGRGVDGTPRRLDAHRWPAGRGEAQHEWEPPRTAHAVKDRPARLKALGNAVVPQQAALAWRVLWARMFGANVRGCSARAA